MADKAVRPLTIDIRYNVKDPDASIIRTDIKSERLQDVLDDYLRSQMGQGADDREYDQRDEHHITITLDLSFDRFRTASDTGNAGLTVGIVMDVMNRLDQLRVLPLAMDLSEEALAVIGQRHDWDLETTRRKVQRTQEVMGLDPLNVATFLMEQVIPGRPRHICDGCNVRPPFEHRCHGRRAVVRGEPTGKPCECTGCFIVHELGAS